MIYVGIDVDKRKLKCAALRPDGKYRAKCVNNAVTGVAELLNWLNSKLGAEAHEQVFILEASGVYHELPAQALHDAKATVHVVNPTHARRFAQSCGVRSKIDEVDAKVLAQFGAERQNLAVFEPEALPIRQLRHLLNRLDALSKDLLREQNRLEKSEIEQVDKVVMGSLMESIQFLKKQVKTLMITWITILIYAMTLSYRRASLALVIYPLPA